MNNPHSILGIKPNATEEEIKKAYREKAKIWHPDRNPGDEEAAKKFKQVQEAYDRLTGKSPQPSIFKPFADSPYDPFADPFNLFNSFFGNVHPGRPHRERGRDIVSECTISFLEAAQGCEVAAKIRRGEKCPA